MPLILALDPLTSWTFWFWAAALAHLALQIALAFRVIMQRRPTGESLAWIMVIFSFPVIGPLLYLTIGELRLGRRRARRFIELYPPIRKWLAELPQRSLVDWSRLDPEFESLSQLGEALIGVPSLRGNHVELIDDWQKVFARLLEDIERA
jgi:cardiolipin synthase